jgi:lipopolysaccharide biosynthesis protein
MHDPDYGLSWRHYLYKNILGSTEVISSILTDFENDEKLGFIFPETFYEAKVHALKMKQPLIDSINFLLNKIFKGYKMGNLFDFPAGDMFWAKFKAVYQIFRVDFSKDICQEGKPLTLLYALERIWLYIVKLNGYYYKKTCDYY